MPSVPRGIASGGAPGPVARMGPLLRPRPSRVIGDRFRRDPYLGDSTSGTCRGKIAGSG
jgi:hypothetical protein